MMPFRNDSSTERFWAAIRRAAGRFEYLSVERFAEKSLTSGQELFTAIRGQILNSDFALADFTLQDGHPNLNVLSEAGVAIGAGKPLYIVARGDYDVIHAALPSDWRGQFVNAFAVSKKANWTQQFVDLFERILNDLGRPRTRAVEKPRTNDAEQLMWITDVVKNVRSACETLYVGGQSGSPNWSVPKGSKLAGLPREYYFNLSSPADVAAGMIVKVGAFFSEWQRGGTPFGAKVTKPDAPAENETWYPLPPERLVADLRTCTTEDVVQALVSHLDDVLLGITPELDRPTTLARFVANLSGDANAIRSVCWSHGGLKPMTSQLRWSATGTKGEFEVVGTPFNLRVLIDYTVWAERGRAHCWLQVTPGDDQSPQILSALRISRALGPVAEAGAVLVPVISKGNFAQTLEKVVSLVVERCQTTAKKLQLIEETEAQNEAAVEPDILLEGYDEDIDDEPEALSEDITHGPGLDGVIPSTP